MDGGRFQITRMRKMQQPSIQPRCVQQLKDHCGRADVIRVDVIRVDVFRVGEFPSAMKAGRPASCAEVSLQNQIERAQASEMMNCFMD